MNTYCISDIHGHWKNFEKFIDTLNDDDIVYVLGDVVDKGDESVKCLQFIMNDPRFVMLMGNHEYMMYQMLSAEKDSYEYFKASFQWLDWNSGRDTFSQYEKLSEYQKKEIFEFIRNLPLNKPEVRVGDNVYYLVHSRPQSEAETRMQDVSYSDEIICSYVWDRVNPFSDKIDIGKTVVAGHTPVQIYTMMEGGTVEPVYDKDNESIQYIDIDGGLASRKETARLIALCLDDMTYRLY